VNVDSLDIANLEVRVLMTLSIVRVTVCWQLYLSDEEFVQVMGCQRNEWSKLPKWKQSQKKKAAELF